MLAGTVEHGDSLGNRGNLGAGDVQWMTAGSGILHQEMPQGDPQGRMHGFQLWANLPVVAQDDGAALSGRRRRATSPRSSMTTARACGSMCGEFWGKRGPVDGVAADPRYLDISVPPGTRKTLPVETTRHAFAYVFAGSGTFRDASQPRDRPDRGRRTAPRRRQIRDERRATDRSSSSTAATKSSCRPATRASASCWFRASRSKSRWRGTGRS